MSVSNRVVSHEGNGGNETTDGSTELSAIKEEIILLATQKNAIEAEVSAILDELNCPPESDPNLPPIGLRNSLIDEEGFPKPGYDIMRIRSRRQRFHCLQTDHTNVMKSIEVALHRLHASQRAKTATSVLTSSADQSSTAPLTNRAQEREEDLDAGPATSIYGDEWWPPRIVAFAKVDEVSYNSPAATGGLKQGDLLISFGKVHAFNWREEYGSNSVLFPLSAVQTELHRAVLNRSEPEFKQGIEVWVLRDDSSQPSLIKITPDLREGQGHLGCHIIPLNIRMEADDNSS
eukprot:542298_1